MPRFMVMIQENEAAAASPLETRELLENQAEYEQRLRASHAYLDGERLRRSAEGTRVSRSRIEAGPFGESVLSSYCVLEAEGLEAAVELARKCPLLPGTEIEVRPVMKGSVTPDKTSQRGRVFAFAVLGSASNEHGWIEVMDRIDEATGSHMPDGPFLGGVRLEAPGRGGRLTIHKGGHVAVFDGPFAEGKEVIGGLFFMRMQSIDEATSWASQSAFMRDATLEIRELWRS